jgi:eukaryotic-like serine/threonine-protein kinase
LKPERQDARAAQPTGSGAPPEVYQAGEVLASKYRLVRPLGAGGMGSVWIARNLVLEIDVAVKLLHVDHATPEAADRLLREARAAARLGHPSIVRVFDFGQTPLGYPFIVMELLHGESLADVLARRDKLAPAAAVQLLLPVASALVAAHAHGIVHRDLKPDNVMLVRDEAGSIVPKLVDFGIVKILDGEVRGAVTQAGDLVGSPAYLSPQQARGLEVDARADIWALSVLLYESVTGRLPFERTTHQALLAAILLDAPTPITELGAGDEALWAVLARGLAKDLGERWPTMRAFGRELAAWAVAHGIEADVAGTSLASHWLSDTPRSLSDAPPPSAPLHELPPASLRAPLSAPLHAPLPPSPEPEPPAAGPSSLVELVTPQAPIARPARSWLWPAVACAGGLAIIAGATALLLPSAPGKPAQEAAAAELPRAAPALTAAAPSAAPAAAPAAPTAAAPAPSAASASPSAAPRAVRVEAKKKPGAEMPVPAQPNF